MLKISIITPSYNQADFLEATIQSILGQGYKNLEYIVIDGGSKDGSVEIIKKYEKFLTYWVSENDRGQSDAINKGLQKATGDIITWINSDDLLYPGVLNKVAALFDQYTDIGLIHGGVTLFEDDKDLRTIYTYGEPIPERYFSGMVFSQPASFYRKKHLDEVGLLQPELHYGMDYDLFARLACVCRFKFVPEVVAKYRLHNQSKSVAENDRFMSDWRKVFVNLCKNLEWKEELAFLNTLPHFQKELSFHYTFPFTIQKDIINGIDKEKVLYFHLVNNIKDLYYQDNIQEAATLYRTLKNKFPSSWQTSDPSFIAVKKKLQLPVSFLKMLKKVKNIGR